MPVTGFSCSGCQLLRPECCFYSFYSLGFCARITTRLLPGDCINWGCIGCWAVFVAFVSVLPPFPPALLIPIHPPSDVSVCGSLRHFCILNRDPLLNYSCPTSCNFKGRNQGIFSPCHNADITYSVY